MDDALKKRLIGATVLVSLVVVFVPMLLQHEPLIDQGIEQSNLPPPPSVDFSSRVIPQKSEPPSVQPKLFSQEDRGTPTELPNTASELAVIKTEQPTDRVEVRESLSAWVIQVGSFSQRDNAENLVKQLREKSFAADIEQVSLKGSMLFRVLVGPEVDRARAEQLLTRVNTEIKPLKLEGTLRSYP
ncbi:MAG: SPOR domain-containing protein [Gammaproteobacteria bacterium]|nr:SPOR domain-containing protein [Gammaproteobacteria bacterium]